MDFSENAELQKLLCKAPSWEVINSISDLLLNWTWHRREKFFSYLQKQTQHWPEHFKNLALATSFVGVYRLTVDEAYENTVDLFAFYVEGQNCRYCKSTHINECYGGEAEVELGFFQVEDFYTVKLKPFFSCYLYSSTEPGEKSGYKDNLINDYHYLCRFVIRDNRFTPDDFVEDLMDEEEHLIFLYGEERGKELFAKEKKQKLNALPEKTTHLKITRFNLEMQNHFDSKYNIDSISSIEEYRKYVESNPSNPRWPCW